MKQNIKDQLEIIERLKEWTAHEEDSIEEYEEKMAVCNGQLERLEKLVRNGIENE